MDDIYVVTNRANGFVQALREPPAIWMTLGGHFDVKHWSFRVVENDCVEPYMEPYLNG